MYTDAQDRQRAVFFDVIPKDGGAGITGSCVLCPAGTRPMPQLDSTVWRACIHHGTPPSSDMDRCPFSMLLNLARRGELRATRACCG